MNIFTTSVKMPDELGKLIFEFESKIPGKTFRAIGGCVRDAILKVPVNDYDLVTDASPDQLISIGLKPINASFPVYIYMHPVLGKVEIACCRTERKVGKGYTGFEVTPCTSFEEDAKRRDLTINACAWHPSKPEEIICYDVDTGLHFSEHALVAMSNAFSEDPVRVIRVARFVAKLLETTGIHWDVSHDTLQLMISLKDEVKNLPPDRLRIELEKMATYSAISFSSFNRVLHYSKITWLFPPGFLSYTGNYTKPDVSTTQGKALFYLELAYSCNYKLKPDIVAWCSTLGLSIANEIFTFIQLVNMVESFTPYTCTLVDDWLRLFTSISRGCVNADDYFKLVSAKLWYATPTNQGAYSDNSSIIVNKIELMYKAYRALKFTPNHSINSINKAKHDLIEEFLTVLFTNSSIDV